MSRERVETILGGYAAFNSGDIGAALEGFAEDIVWEVPDVLPDAGPFAGREGVRRFWELWRENFTDFRVELGEVIDAGDHVIVMIRVRGRGRDSGVEVTTPEFPQVWTWRGDAIAHVRMLTSREEALAEAGVENSASSLRRGERSP
jgi:ketosteroid isomerase-like protein